eukprot:gene7483-8977_t
MSDLKAFVSSYKALSHKFIPFLPDDNLSHDFDSSKVLLSNVEGIKALLKANFLTFLCDLSNNQSWHQFLESYFLCRKKMNEEFVEDLWKLDQLVYLVFLRLVTTTEVNTIDSLLPKVAASSLSEKNNKRDKNVESSSGEEDGSKRQQLLLDQYKQILSTLPFLRAPCILDLAAILGQENAFLSARLVKGLYEVKSSFGKEVNDALMESVKTLDRVHQSVIILSRKMLERKTTADGKAPKVKTSSSLSVLSGARPTAAQEKQSKLSAAEEYIFLCEFGADIVASISTFVLVLEAAEVLSSSTILCLNGTRLTGALGLSLVRGFQNLYEVLLPLFTRCSTSPSASSVSNNGAAVVDVTHLRACLGSMQIHALSLLHTLLGSTLRAAQELQSKAGKSYDQLFDSMDILREDAIEWLTVFQGQDPLGRDPLKLTASSTNLGEVTSGKVVSTAVASTNKGNVPGVVHTIDETEVLRGVYLADYMRVYGASQVEAAVALSFGGEADPERLAYVLKSLQTEESLLLKKQTSTPRPSRSMETTTSFPVAESKKQSVEESHSEGVKNIKAIFPDLGEGFIEACISAYKGNIEEVIDALLTDNLQPTLLVLDRSLQKMWRGKGGNTTQDTISLDASQRDKKTVYKAVEDAEFKRLQKERLLKMEQQQEMDHMLLMREYNDDYDDQYDEYQAVDLLRSQPQGSEKESRAPSLPSASSHKPSSMSAPAAVPVSAELLNRRERRKGKATAVASGLPVPPVAAVSSKGAASQQMSTAKVHQQMAEMKRLNTLTRDAEVEDAFWEGMRNTNRHSAVTSGKGSWKAELQRQEEEQAQETQQRAAERVTTSTGAGRPQPAGTAGNKNQPGSNTAQQPNARASQPKVATGPPSTNNGGSGGASANAQGKPGATAGGPRPSNNAQTQKPKPKGDASEKSVDGSVASEDSKKHRTKRFDKHHQQDKANRKFAHFAPQT